MATETDKNADKADCPFYSSTLLKPLLRGIKHSKVKNSTFYPEFYFDPCKQTEQVLWQKSIEIGWDTTSSCCLDAFLLRGGVESLKQIWFPWNRIIRCSFCWGRHVCNSTNVTFRSVRCLTRPLELLECSEECTCTLRVNSGLFGWK